ncbi:MAG: hypothetical protein GTO14_10645 [Anaerolineales bacterium]|nr:hypothetical protein [Anaerolineales bacterium]
MPVAKIIMLGTHRRDFTKLNVTLKDSFNDQAAAIIQQAYEIALDYRHPYVDIAHILMAYLETADKLIIKLFEHNGSCIDRVRQRAQALLNALPSSPLLPKRRDLMITSRVKLVFSHARQESIRQSDRAVSPEHLLIALATVDFDAEVERGAHRARLLAPLDLTPHQMRQKLIFPMRDEIT